MGHYSFPKPRRGETLFNKLVPFPKPQSIPQKKPQKLELFKCGPGEIRTLVQTWDQLRFLHAYFAVGFRD